jgi:hypothetical protein
MSKKSHRKDVSPAPRRFPWLWMAAGAATLLIAGGLAILSTSTPTSPAARPAAPPQVTGAPRMAVDRTAVDEGYVKFGTPVHETFRLSNVGNRPLQILGKPQVELVQGC